VINFTYERPVALPGTTVFGDSLSQALISARLLDAWNESITLIKKQAALPQCS